MFDTLWRYRIVCQTSTRDTVIIQCKKINGLHNSVCNCWKMNIPTLMFQVEHWGLNFISEIEPQTGNLFMISLGHYWLVNVSLQLLVTNTPFPGRKVRQCALHSGKQDGQIQIIKHRNHTKVMIFRFIERYIKYSYIHSFMRIRTWWWCGELIRLKETANCVP